MADKKNNIWLRRASDAYSASTTYVDANYRRQWEDNLRIFNNKHPNGSKYLSNEYKYRSKLFRPKTRSVIRNNEAAAAAAFFSSMDVVTIEPFAERNNLQKASAEFRNELLEYRLQNTIPWYLTCVGGMQDAQTHGVVCSYQYWDTKKDEPAIDLIPIENVRIDPASSWIDPVNSSPYVILLLPTYIYEIKDKIRTNEWLPIDDKSLTAAKTEHMDTTRLARENDREDPQQQANIGDLSDYDIVYVHLNIMASPDGDQVYFTLGTEELLTEPKPLKELFWHGVRPIIIGTAIIETHKIFAAGVAELGAGLQKEANEIANQRLDNVKLVLNKRWIGKRGVDLDTDSLTKNVPGSVTLTNDPINDVRAESFPDVTGSSYSEQDRVNVDFDELLGSFSSGSIQTNRSLNETVGGMAMLRSGSNMMTQYLIQVFSETWVEKVLRQLDMLEQYYESDEELLLMIAEKIKLKEKYQISAVTSELFFQRAQVTVNIANSATDPTIRLEQLLLAITKYAEIAATAPPDIDLKEVAKEIFGRLGYRDGRRFFAEEEEGADPEKEQLKAALQQMQAALEGKQVEIQAEMQTKLQIEQFKQQNENLRLKAKIDSDQRMKQLEMQLRHASEMEKVTLLEQGKKYNAELESATRLNIAGIGNQLDTKKFIADVKERAKANQGEELERKSIIDFTTGVKEQVSALTEEIAESEEKRELTKAVIIDYLKKKAKDAPELNNLIERLPD